MSLHTIFVSWVHTLRNLNGADINLADQPDIVNALLSNAELPNLDMEAYISGRETAQMMDRARADYSDDPDNNVVGDPNQASPTAEGPTKSPKQPSAAKVKPNKPTQENK